MDRFRQPIWHVAYRFTASPDDADELTQDIFMQLLRVLPRYRPSGSLGAWVRQVATNAAIDSYRRRRRLPDFLPEEEVAREAAVPRRWQPDAIVEREQEARRVRRLIASLQPELAEPVMLRDLMELSYPEIAERLAIPVGTVKSRIHRGRSALIRGRETLRSRAREAVSG